MNENREIDYEKKLRPFIDEDGKFKAYPPKKPMREIVLARIAEKFEEGRNYTEKEVNEIIRSAISFSDHELIRRELYQMRFLNREIDGSRYWKEKKDI